MLKLIRFLKPYRWIAVLSIFLVFVQSIAELFLPTLMAEIVDRGIVDQDTALILRIGVTMLLITALGTLGAVVGSYLAAKASGGFGRDLRKEIFGHVTDFSLREFDQHGTATLITRTTNDVTQVQQVLHMILRMMVRAPMMITGGIIMAVSKDPTLSLVILVVIPVLAAVIGLIASRATPLFNVIQEKLDRLNLIVRESLTGVRVIRAFHRIEHEEQRFETANDDLMKTSITVNKIMALMNPAMTLIFSLTTVAVLWFGGIRIDNNHMQVGDLMAFIQYVTQIMFSLMMLTMIFVMIPRASVSARRINDVLTTEPTIINPDSSYTGTPERSLLEFNNVTFRYPGAEAPALANLSFRSAAGEITAIIGGIGSGKSTLAALIPRFYDVSEGTISIGGIDIRKYSQEQLRLKIGFVAQRALLFSGTVAENIRYGKEDATDEEVQHAARIAQAHQFITEMPDEYDSFVTQGGTNLSGGQKQRLTIARALVRKPEIYIFDDNFSALDLKTEAKLRAALQSEIQNATVIIVAQRISTIIDADRIIVLDEGRVAGIGRHDQLLETCEVYRQIVASQLAEEAIA